MSLTGLLLGLINICIVVAVLVLIGYVIVWILGIIGFAVPAQVQKIYMVIVALIALYMIVALLLGIPSFKIISGGQSQVPPIHATIPPVPDITVGNR
jgi:bacteriorhodopsin